MSKLFSVYILTNKPKGTLYIGSTSNLHQRIWEHKSKLIEGFSKKYNLTMLVYFESTDDLFACLEKERQLKNWHRQWKINLIEQNNPKWADLYETLL